MYLSNCVLHPAPSSTRCSIGAESSFIHYILTFAKKMKDEYLLSVVEHKLSTIEHYRAWCWMQSYIYYYQLINC